MEKISTQEVIDWSKDFLFKAESEITEEEKKEQQKYAILIQNPNDKILLSKLLDESSQIHNNKKLARRMKLLIEKYGVPEFFSKSDNQMLRLFTNFGYLFDFISVPLFKARLRSDTANVIINEKASLLHLHLIERKKQGIGQNVNLLGEVVLGNAEADKRYHHYLTALEDPHINYISIKISGIYAQINPLNYAQNKLELCERLTNIYQQSINCPYIGDNGIASSKFVNLDMEDYKDAELTMDVFKTVLSQTRFKSYTAGIVIQAYLPDAWHFQTELLDFAKARITSGGTPLKMRLVKGANLQMESIISSLKGWSNPILHSKVEVDANYLHILDRALEPENAKALHIGVASHNFFSIAYAYLLSKKNKVEDKVTFEMLEGMANHLPRVMRNMGKQIILYTPVVKNEHFLNAVSYLVRRLDENTGKDNFLSYSFGLKYNSKEWEFLQQQFIDAYNLKDCIDPTPFRSQNRNEEQETKNTEQDTFKNEPDTFFDTQQNRHWAMGIRNDWMKNSNSKPYQIPIQIGNETATSDKKIQYFDKSQNNKVLVCETSLSNLNQIKEIIEIAENDIANWKETTLKERSFILHKAAENLSNNRGNLIGCMSAITGKTFLEGDVEVSEAIDFCRYYPETIKAFEDLKTVSISPKGIVLVITPWNFPLAIPVGGIASALASGNTVILKPATAALPVAWEFAQYFWAAGIPKEALQIVCTDSREALNYLTGHSSVKHIIMTGGTDTAYSLLENNPTCPLSAETGGKNSIILTSSGDRDHAIQNIVSSAFSNAGQKCSACSLLLLEKEVYNDPDFKIKLKDAVTSMQTGSVWEGGNLVGPMITNQNEKLLYAVAHLEEGESWLVAPEFIDQKKFILKPTVKWGVKPSSYTFKNELFAPLLAVVCIDNLEQGIDIMNKSEFGLTSGLQSLDEAEQLKWKNKLKAGNLYINRGITGAIVNRQPFGGMKRSAFGGGLKAGGRNYVSQLVNIVETKYEYITTENERFKAFGEQLDATEKARFNTAVESYLKNWEIEFSLELDINNIMGEKNTFRYLPLEKIALRVQPLDNLCDIFMIIAAAKIAKTPIVISINADDSKLEIIKKLAQNKFKLKVQTETHFLSEIEIYERIRICNNSISNEFYIQAAKKGKYIAMAKPTIEGRLELLHYLKEQSIAFEYHRYGSITEPKE